MDAIVTLRIALLGIEPPIWRRLEVPAAYHLGELHAALNTAMGWLDYHLHEFEIGGRRYGVPDVDFAPEADNTLPEENIVLGDLARTGVKLFEYTYDFGDDWRHSVVVEKTGPGEEVLFYPRCIAGLGACPPEDCGGLAGFEDFKEAMANPDHPEHKSLKRWYGGDFDPGEFSAEEASKLLRMMATGEPPEGWR
ncbi:MAG TPA: plasmid pRiA4b ORF-3 family protein [Thermoleophilia bacterium]|nr:plasmid pRiA4b ORF-3 family protein [Thermoleophilia bacterium]